MNHMPRLLSLVEGMMAASRADSTMELPSSASADFHARCCLLVEAMLVGKQLLACDLRPATGVMELPSTSAVFLACLPAEGLETP